MDKLPFCPSCVESWPAKKKEQILAKLFEGSKPVGFFTVPKVTTDEPANPGRFMLVGDLAFTDRGIYFAHFSQYHVASSGLGVFLYSGAFGGILGGMKDAKARNNALTKREEFLEQKAGSDRGLRGLLESAIQILVFPRDSKIKMKFGPSGTSFRLRYREGGRSYYFDFDLDKEGYDKFESRIKEYAAGTITYEKMEAMNEKAESAREEDVAGAEKCENCKRVIRKSETPWVLDDRVVCNECWQRLKNGGDDKSEEVSEAAADKLDTCRSCGRKIGESERAIVVDGELVCDECEEKMPPSENN